MIKTVPRTTISPQMWCINGIKGWFIRTQICWQDCKVKMSNAKNLAWFFFPDLINLCHAQEPLWLLKVIEDDYRVLGVHMRLSSLWKIWFTLGLFANYFSLKSCSLSLNSHKNVTLVPELFFIFLCERDQEQAAKRQQRVAKVTRRERKFSGYLCFESHFHADDRVRIWPSGVDWFDIFSNTQTNLIGSFNCNYRGDAEDFHTSFCLSLLGKKIVCMLHSQ